MSKHVLLEHSTRREYVDVPSLPKFAIYDCEAGYWRLNGTPLVRDKDFNHSQCSKKADVETGEDQKGE